MYKLTTATTVIGTDVHKYTHTAVALNCLGKELDTIEFSNQKLAAFEDWLGKLGTQDSLVIGLEDVNGHGLHITRHLLKSKFHVVYVPPVLTERQRIRSTHREKTDRIDAKRVGKAILNRIEEALPATDIVSSKFATVRSIDLLVQEYDNLCRDQTRLKNQLHALLHQYYGDEYRQGYKNPFTRKAMSWYQKDLEKSRHLDQLTGSLASGLLRRLTKLTLVQGQLKTTLKELGLITENHREVQILRGKIPGCGLLTACRIVSEVGDIKRFKTADKLARYMGLSPVQRSSGQRKRLHIDKYGNRKLNKAIHWVAIAQIGRSGHEPAKRYYKRKQEEGKSKLWALRCLKRQIVKVVFKQLNISSDNV